MVWAVAMLPGIYWWGAALTDQLGSNPAEALIRGLGESTLQLLCVVLLITPLRVATGWASLARWRRPLGLAVFAHALLHAVAYAWLDQSWDVAALMLDVWDRPFITVGLANKRSATSCPGVGRGGMGGSAGWPARSCSVGRGRNSKALGCAGAWMVRR